MKLHRRSFAGYNEQSAAERKPVTGAGKQCSNSGESTSTSKTSAVTFITKSHGN
jgi:hypothetical protein